MLCQGLHGPERDMHQLGICRVQVTYIEMYFSINYFLDSAHFHLKIVQ